MAALKSSEQVFIIGPAGTGKTFIPTAYAADQLNSKLIKKLVLTRPNVPAGPSLGYFPGELNDKMAPWVVPFIDTLSERLGRSHVEAMVKSGRIEIVPFEVMRGRSYADALIIVDEAQNITPNEMYMVLTRVGENSQIVITGDVRQKDIKGNSGLSEALSRIKQYDIPATVIEFTHEDVVRGGICALWVKCWGN